MPTPLEQAESDYWDAFYNYSVRGWASTPVDGQNAGDVRAAWITAMIAYNEARITAAETG
jgi:hypothetical protein